MTQAAFALPHAARLGPDLAELVREVGVPLRDVTELTRLRSPDRRRAAYCLRFADGTLLKGRRLYSPAHAERVARLMALADDARLPRVRARRGAALLLDWVEGEPLPAASPPAAALAACAALQARIHALPVPSPDRPRFTLDELRRHLGRDGRLLAARGLLSTSEALDCANVAGRGAQRAELCVMHGDLCGENVVATPDGGWKVVDNENLDVGYGAYDLARTWFRWSLSGAERRLYREAYEQAGGAAELRDDATFWMAAVLAESAVYRLKTQGGAVGAPLEALRSLLARHRARASIEPEPGT